VSQHPSHAQIWRRYDAMELQLSAPLTARMLELAHLQVGMQVLDLASGRGEPAIAAARRVGPQGRVCGVDIDGELLTMAQARAQAEGLHNLDWRLTTAESLDGVPRGHFDRCLIRWGLMYFVDPVSALRTARRALKASGRLVAALWAEPERVDYHQLPRSVLERLAPLPAIDFEQPGTFRYADPVWITRDFRAAGWRIEQIDEICVDVVGASDAGDVIAWVRDIGLARLLRSQSVQTLKAWEYDLAVELERRRGPDGIRLGGVTRIVVASPDPGASAE
jgi:SAM-dependent methyltransferase